MLDRSINTVVWQAGAKLLCLKAQCKQIQIKAGYLARKTVLCIFRIITSTFFLIHL